MGQPFVPPIQRHLCRPTTKAASKRSFDRLVTNINSQVGDVVNPTGDHAGVETPGGGGGSTGAAHAVSADAGTQAFTSPGSDMVLSSATFDTDGWYTAGIITVSIKGIYLVQCIANWSATAGNGFTMGIHQNGVLVGIVSLLDAPTSDPFSQSISQNVSLNAGDIVSASLSATPARSIIGGNLQVTLIGTT